MSRSATKPPRFLEVEYGMWNTPVGLRMERGKVTLNEIGVAILGALSDHDLDIMRSHPDPMQLLRDKYPTKLKCSKIQIDLYENLDDYNYVFTVYGRDNPDIFTMPYSEIKELKEKALTPLSTIDDEMWANPFAVLYHTPGIDRENYLQGFSIRALAAVRNYLYHEDPQYLNVCDESETKAVFTALYKRSIVLKRGAFYVPSRLKRRPRLKFKSKMFKPLHSTFAALEKFPVSLNEDVPSVIHLQSLVTERTTLRVYMQEERANPMVYGSPYFDKTIENLSKKLTYNRIILIFNTRQLYNIAAQTPHYNHPNVSRLAYVAYQIQQKLFPKRVIFNSFNN